MRGVDFEVATRRGVRLPRPQRRRQDDDDQHALHAGQADRRASATVAGHDVVTRARRRAPQHRPGLPGPDARRLPDRRAEPAPARRALRRRSPTWSRRGCSRCSRWSACGSRKDSPVGDVLGRHAPAAGDRARADALAARAVPRRADDRPRPADAQLDLELHPRAQGARGDHDLHDHALHGRGRVLRPDRDHGPRRDRRARHARGAEGQRRRRPRADPHRRRRGRDRRARASASGSRRGSPRARSRSRVPAGEEFVPRLFAELGVPIRSVNVSRPTLDDVFMSYTGTHDPRRRGGPGAARATA